MDSRCYEAMIDVAATAGRAAADTPYLPPVVGGIPADDALVGLAAEMNARALAMSAQWVHRAKLLEVLIFDGVASLSSGDMGEI